MFPFGFKEDKWFYFASALVVLYLTTHKMSGKGWEDLLKMFNGMLLSTSRSVSAIISGGNINVEAGRKKKKGDE